MAGFFIGVGNDNAQTKPYVATSPNGTTWTDHSTAATTAFSAGLLNGIATNGSRWVAVGVSATDFSTPVIITSDDQGVTWTSRTPAPTTNAYLMAVCWTGVNFIAVGSQSDLATPRVMTSSDGTTWTARTADPTTATRYFGVAGVSGLAIAVGYQNVATEPPRIATSTDDGVTWTARTGDPTTHNRLTSVALNSNHSINVAVGADNGGAGSATRVEESSDGTTWTAQTGAPTTDAVYAGVSFDGTRFIAIGSAGSGGGGNAKVMTSTNGTTWTGRTAPTVAGFTQGIAAAPSGAVAVGWDNTQANPTIFFSSDGGVTWSTPTVPGPANTNLLNAVAVTGSFAAAATKVRGYIFG